MRRLGANTHEQRGVPFMGAARIEGYTASSLGSEWDGLGLEEEDQDAVIATALLMQEIDDGEDVLPPYKLPILLPSSLSPAEIQRRNLQDALQMELELRKGDAEDFLAELRVLLAWKSVVLRHRICLADNYTKRRDAWEDVNDIGDSIRRNVRAYEHTRRIMWSIADEQSEDGQEIRRRFRVFGKNDYKITTEYISWTIRETRHQHQSWIWNSGGETDVQNDAWLAECRYIVLLHASPVFISPIRSSSCLAAR